MQRATAQVGGPLAVSAFSHGMTKDGATPVPNSEERVRSVKEHFVQQDKDDFHWTYGPIPHHERSRLILKKYPEVKKLMGYDPITKYYVLGMLFVHYSVAWYVSKHGYTVHDWLFWVLAYVVGSTMISSLTLAMHEISHNMAFRDFRLNRIFNAFLTASFPFPASEMFKAYHSDHHRYLGYDKYDVDIPTRWEAWLLKSLPGKMFFLTFQVVFYAIRPLLLNPNPKQLDHWYYVNMATTAVHHTLVWALMGPNALLYFCVAMLVSSLNPIAAHYLAEHYCFWPPYETACYLGPLNAICFNAGYHVEHHDLPNIPWTKLPELRRIAHEFYEDIPVVMSWSKVFWDFLFYYDVNLFSRVKRKPLGAYYEDLRKKLKACEERNDIRGRGVWVRKSKHE